MAVGAGIYTGDALTVDVSLRGENVLFSTNEHGPERFSCDLRLSLAEAFAQFDPNDTPTARVKWNGLTLFRGRVEDKHISDGQASLKAFGPWRSLSDVPYSALFSTTRVDDFIPLTKAQIATCIPEKWELNTDQNAIYLAPKKNENFANNNDLGYLSFSIPDQSSRNLAGVQFDFEYKGPVNWLARFESRSYDYSAGTTVWSLNGNGAVQTGSIYATFTARERCGFYMINTTGGNVLKATDTGVDYLRITNVRLVSTTTYAVSTTLTVARTNGSPVTCTVGSTARMYVGQRLIINSGGANSESVIVLSIPSSTTFTANVVNAPGGGYPIGTTVQAHVVYADSVVGAIINTVIADNPDQLASNVALVQSPGLDLTDEVYEDGDMQDILTKLADYGDMQRRRWEVGVGNNQVLYFQPQNTTGRTWYVDASDIDIERTLDNLRNRTYAVYSEPGGRKVRSAATDDATSISRYGIIRKSALNVDSTSSTQAQTQVNTSLEDTADPRPRAGVVFRMVYNLHGAPAMLFEPTGGDTIVIRNLPPNISTTVDQIRKFRIAHTEYSFDNDTLTVEPDVPQPALDYLVGRLAIGLNG